MSILTEASTGDYPCQGRYRVVPRSKVWHYVSAVIVLACLAFIVSAFWMGGIRWDIVGANLFSTNIISGAVNTLILTAASMVAGIALGLVAALMTLSTNPVLNATARGYILLFRAVPVLLQLLIWYNLGLIFPELGVPGLLLVKTTDAMSPFLASLLAFSLMQGAYTSEVIRAGLLSVGRGQVEAAKSIGMTPGRAMRRIVLPQAMVFIIPPIGNEVIGMIKYTSLASIIQYRDIIFSAQSVYYTNGRVIEMLMVCAFWYLVMVTVLTFIQKAVERYFGRHQVR